MEIKDRNIKKLNKDKADKSKAAVYFWRIAEPHDAAAPPAPHMSREARPPPHSSRRQKPFFDRAHHHDSLWWTFYQNLNFATDIQNICSITHLDSILPHCELVAIF